MFTKVKTAEEISNLRESGRQLAAVLNELDKQVSPGMTTKDVDMLARAELKKLKDAGQPAFLNYEGFPASLCVSVNEEIVHGIPGPRLLESGDVVTFDFGVNFRGMITDSAFTKILGDNPTPDVKRLVEGTRQALYDGISVLKDGVRVGDISAAVEKSLKKSKLGIVREFVGHGVGHELHEEPNIPNYGTAGTGPTLKAGMTIAIEPMAMLGEEKVGIYDDGWTVTTADQSLASHFEHTILITQDGSEILTER